MQTTLKARLLTYLKGNPGFHAKGNLADLARASELHATGEATGRRLRELHEEGLVEVIYKGNHAHYRYLASPKQTEGIEATLHAMEKYFARI